MKNGWRVLSIIGFSVLSGLFGLGVTWLIVAIFYVRNNDERLAKVMPLLLAGGVIGFIAGLSFVLRTTKGGQKAEEAFENKYVGRSGRAKIYFGAPVFLTILGEFLFGENLLNKFGNSTGTYFGLGVFLALVGASLFLYDRIPKTLVIPIGIIGWLLTVLLALWFCL